MRRREGGPAPGTETARDPKAVEGIGRSSNRIGKPGCAIPIAGRIERMRRTTVTLRIGAFGKRTRRITRTCDVRRTKAAYAANRPNRGSAADAGRPTARTIAPGATAAA